MHPLTAGLTITCLILIGLHWMPYPRRLHAIGNYTLGTAAIFIGMTIWRRDWSMWLFPIAAGVTVSLCYLVDYLLNLRVKAALRESADDRVSETPSD